MEAGFGTVFRLQPDQVDVVVVVAEPTAKGIDVALRAASVGATRARVIVVANRITEPDDLEAIRSVLGEQEIVVVPEEPVIEQADIEGVAPIDLDPDAPGVVALTGLAERIVASR